MRKLWFSHLARALVVFPGGFGTLDEMMEILTLSQTRKLDRAIEVVLYGADYWREIVNFEALVRYGMIDAADLGLFHFADDPRASLSILQARLPAEPGAATPAFAKSCASASAIAHRSSDAGEIECPPERVSPGSGTVPHARGAGATDCCDTPRVGHT